MRVAILIGTMKGAFLLQPLAGDRTSWQLTGPLFKGWQVTAANRATDGRFVIATSSFVYGAGLHLSSNLESWQPVENGPRYAPEENRMLKQIWTLANTPQGMIAGVSEAGLFRAWDPSGPWEPLSGFNDHPTRSAWQPGLGGLCAHVILTNPHNPHQLWCGVSAVGVFRSDDGGLSWEPKNNGIPVAIADKTFPDIGFCVHGLAANPHDPLTLYRQDHLGMFRSRDGGDSWHRNEEGLPSGFGFPIKTDPQTGAVFCYPLESDEHRLPAEGNMDVYRSTNGGDSWHASSGGLPRGNSYAGVLRGAMDVDGMDPCGVYFGTTAGTVHVSVNP